MTKLSERIEAAEPGANLTELGAEVLSCLAGHELYCVPSEITAGRFVNPLTDLNAIAALEQEYGKLPLRIQISHNNLVAVMWEHGSRRDWTTAPTEPLARSAALVRALEVSRDA